MVQALSQFEDTNYINRIANVSHWTCSNWTFINLYNQGYTVKYLGYGYPHLVRICHHTVVLMRTVSSRDFPSQPKFHILCLALITGCTKQAGSSSVWISHTGVTKPVPFSAPRSEKHLLGEERGRKGGIAKQKGKGDKSWNPLWQCVTWGRSKKKHFNFARKEEKNSYTNSTREF